MMKLKNGPSFIIIGPHRTGTTWLHENLSMHPEINMNSGPKEAHFFDRECNYNKGIDYYLKLFSSKKISGEDTPNYFCSETVPSRIKEHFPDIKLILILRDPAERLFSLYNLHVGSWGNTETFEEFYKRKTECVEEGRYINHLKRYLNYFSASQILILFFNDVEKNPCNVYSRVLNFIGCNDISYYPTNLEKKRNSFNMKLHYSKYKVLYYVMLFLKKMRFYKYSLFFEQINKSTSQVYLQKEDRKRLINIYKSYNNELSEYLNINLDSWSKV